MSIRKKRSQFIAFYVDEQEKAAIVKAARRADLSISDYCRKTLINEAEAKGEGQTYVRKDTE